MKLGRSTIAAAAAVALVVGATLAAAQVHVHPPAPADGAPADARTLVRLPEPMRLHTIASMRDHLQSLQAIDVALSRGDFDQAASVAESRL